MTDHAAHDHADDHGSHGKTYFTVFLALCGFTLASIVADVLNLSNRSVLVTIILAIATSKALCVMMFFMHLKFERAWKYLLLAPTAVLAAAIPFSLFPDISAPYWTRDVPQLSETELVEQAIAAGHGGGSHHGSGHGSGHGSSGAAESTYHGKPEH